MLACRWIYLFYKISKVHRRFCAQDGVGELKLAWMGVVSGTIQCNGTWCAPSTLRLLGRVLLAGVWMRNCKMIDLLSRCRVEIKFWMKYWASADDLVLKQKVQYPFSHQQLLLFYRHLAVGPLQSRIILTFYSHMLVSSSLSGGEHVSTNSSLCSSHIYNFCIIMQLHATYTTAAIYKYFCRAVI